jgi:HK97 gp10 family phage protein
MKIKIEGLRELDKALGELSKSQAKSTLRRTLKNAAQPIADAAEAKAPKQTGKLSKSIGVTTKAPANYEVGKIAYSQTMKDGGDSKSAVAAMRSARKANPATFSQVFIAPGATRGNRLKQALFQEFGTVNHPPQPYMRPAWEGGKMGALDTIAESLAAEIEKTRKRVAVRAAKKALKG